MPTVYWIRSDKYAELEADRDKWEQEAGEQHARALSFQKQQQRLVEAIKKHRDINEALPDWKTQADADMELWASIGGMEKDDE